MFEMQSSQSGFVPGRYEWTRFWIERGSRDGGRLRDYLPEPPLDQALPSGQGICRLPDLLAVPCLALLGEPGMGKSTAFEFERSEIDELLHVGGSTSFWLRLRSYLSDDRFVRDFFESPEFIAWATGVHTMHVFLDDFDECHLRIETMVALLTDRLRAYSLDAIRDRLRLRIACRTFAWPASLETALTELWGNDGFAAYELAPLRRNDVAIAAEVHGLDPEAFLAEIDKIEARPLASRPITLTLLLRLYLGSRGLPSKRADLYDQGCDILCRESNLERRDSRRTGELTPLQRRAIAGRIAAVTVFAGRFAVGEERGVDSEDELITIPELAGGTEYVDDAELRVDEAAIRDTLQTPLFIGRGVNRVGWAHQTLGEFLAADHLVRRNVALPQVMSLLVHPVDVEGRIAPQLRGVAAELASRRIDVFEEILRSDPVVLLISDLGSVNEPDRVDLVTAILESYDSGKLIDAYPNWELRRRYDRLEHEGLADQLRVYIGDNSKTESARRVAIDIAEACGLRQLSNDLADLALNSSVSLAIRIRAAYALVEIGNDEVKARLKTLVLLPPSEDPNEELKGCGLLATWPAHLTAEELFNVLSARRRDLFGAYSLFLYRAPMEHLQACDLSTALSWVENHGVRPDPPYDLREIIGAILRFSWDRLDDPGIVTPFARITMLRLRHYNEVLGERGEEEARELLMSDVGRRRRLLAAVVPMIPNLRQDLWSLHQHGLAQSSDLPWVLTRLQTERSTSRMRRWVQLAIHLLNPHDRAGLYSLWSMLNDDLILREIGASLISQFPLLQLEFGPLFDPVLISSPQTQRAKEAFERREAIQRRYQEEADRQLQLDPTLVRVKRDLERFENGDLDAWWHLNWQMARGADGYLSNDYEPDLTIFPAWQEADAETRGRIIRAGNRYIREQMPAPEKWIASGTGTNFTIFLPDNAGHRAFELLYREAPECLKTLAPEIWHRWAPVITAYRHRFAGGDHAVQRALIASAYAHAPEEIASTLMRLIDRANDANLSFDDSIQSISDCWDENWAAALLNKARDPQLTAQGVSTLLNFLLDREVDRACAFAIELVGNRSSANKKDREVAVVAAMALVLHTRDAGWATIWTAIQADSDFGNEVLSRIAGMMAREEILFTKLSETQLAELYLWLARRYPHDEDPNPMGFHEVTPREDIGHWRDMLLSHLQHRGTPDAVEAVGGIANELPHLTWLQRTLYGTREMTRWATWKWPTPEVVLQLLKNRNHRLIHNADQLLELVVESLHRLDHRLQQEESRAVADLWNAIPKASIRGIAAGVLANLRRKIGQGTPALTINGYWSEFGKQVNVLCSPKEENLLSDYVKRHLDDDLQGRGIVINREVQNRRREITDIRIDAVQYGPQRQVLDIVTVIIEVKGCWHAQLGNAMRSQLVNNYLQPVGIRHGIYLVGWFNDDQWDSNDPRKRQAPDMTLEQAREHFNQQAASQSTNEVAVTAFVLDGSLRGSSSMFGSSTVAIGGS